jgi:hypothetical protein
MSSRRTLSFYLFMVIFLGGCLSNFWFLCWWLALLSDVAAYAVVGGFINWVGQFHCPRIVLWWLPMLLLPKLDWLAILRLGGKKKEKS